MQRDYEITSVFLQNFTDSTCILIYRSCNSLYINVLYFRSVCRICSKGIMCVMIQLFFIWLFRAFPFRSGYAGVSSSQSSNVAGSFLTGNFIVLLRQRCFLTIPNAETRLPFLLPGHLSLAQVWQAERNTAILSHGCTPFRSDIGFRRYAFAAYWLECISSKDCWHNCCIVLLFFGSVVSCIAQRLCFRVC